MNRLIALLIIIALIAVAFLLASKKAKASPTQTTIDTSYHGRFANVKILDKNAVYKMSFSDKGRVDLVSVRVNPLKSVFVYYDIYFKNNYPFSVQYSVVRNDNETLFETYTKYTRPSLFEKIKKLTDGLEKKHNISKRVIAKCREKKEQYRKDEQVKKEKKEIKNKSMPNPDAVIDKLLEQ